MLRTQNDTPFSCHECRKVCAVSCCLVIAKVRVSGGHLCKAEAPTEPTGETQSDCGNPFFPFKIIKSSCARAARAPYFCPYRNRGKNRRTPYGLGFRTFPNEQRDKLPFGNLYYIEIRYVPINNVKKAYTEKDLKICEKLLRDNAEQFTGCYRDNLKIIL